MNTNKGSVVKQSGNDVEGCRSQKVLFQLNMRVFLQYSVNERDKYGVSFFEQRYTHGSCKITLFKYKSFDWSDPPESTQILDICLVVVLYPYEFQMHLKCIEVAHLNFINFTFKLHLEQ